MKKIASVAAAAVLGLGSTFAAATMASAAEGGEAKTEWRSTTQSSEYLADKSCFFITTGGDQNAIRDTCTDAVQINPDQWVASYQVNVPA